MLYQAGRRGGVMTARAGVGGRAGRPSAPPRQNTDYAAHGPATTLSALPHVSFTEPVVGLLWPSYTEMLHVESIDTETAAWHHALHADTGASPPAGEPGVPAPATPRHVPSEALAGCMPLAHHQCVVPVAHTTPDDCLDRKRDRTLQLLRAISSATERQRAIPSAIALLQPYEENRCHVRKQGHPTIA